MCLDIVTSEAAKRDLKDRLASPGIATTYKQIPVDSNSDLSQPGWNIRVFTHRDFLSAYSRKPSPLGFLVVSDADRVDQVHDGMKFIERIPIDVVKGVTSEEECLEDPCQLP